MKWFPSLVKSLAYLKRKQAGLLVGFFVFVAFLFFARTGSTDYADYTDYTEKEKMVKGIYGVPSGEKKEVNGLAQRRSRNTGEGAKSDESRITNRDIGNIESTNSKPIRGIYGVPSISERDPLSYVGDMEKAGVNAVFVKPDRDTVKWFTERDFKVFVSVDAYGGSKAWKEFPDSRPVLADGSLLGENRKYACHGGACPTHVGWKRDRLSYIEGLLRDFDGADGRIGGIWLDYIRYPGRWSVLNPQIPDTCYCERCLRKFSKNAGIAVPIGMDTKEVSLWIKENCPYEWMKWKKEQINSFVSDVRKVLNRWPVESRPILGIFLVPWTKGEKENAGSFAFGQDGFQLGKYADVLSPMVYHKRVGRPPSWVGFMTRYYEETVPCQVWPIVQAMDCTVEEFAEVMQYAGQGGADGVLGYPFGAVDKAGLWEGFKEFERLPNLLSKGLAQRRQGAKIGEDAAAICPGYGECGEWVVPLDGCEAGAVYEFRGEFWQRVWENGKYPEVSLWEKPFLLNTHWKSKRFQPLRVYVMCPDEVTDQAFRFLNCNPGKRIELRKPEVRRYYRFHPSPKIPVKRAFFNEGFFPIGVYGANLENLEEIKRLAVNTVVLQGSGKKLRDQVEKCHSVGLRYVLTTPHEPDRLPVYLAEIAEYARPYDMAFYVNDEPGIHSFPTKKALDVNRLIKDRFPKCATCMAIVRPQVCGEYADGADFFMLDQYPVPYMPMTWLSECMDICAKGIAQSAERIASTDYADCAGEKESLTQRRSRNTGEDAKKGRLAAVIQAFGGPGRLDHPRMPTWQEMDCLAFLSVVHGSRGIFFYTFNWIGKTEEGQERLGRVVGRLNRVYPWLVKENSGETVQVEMVSENRFDPKGRAAVHCCLKRKGKEWMVIAVNTIGTYVEAELSAESMAHGAWGKGERAKGMAHGEKRMVQEVFSGEDYAVVDGKIRVRFGPYEAKAFLSTDYAD